jgi:trimethylamine corrinoid protein
MIKRRRGMSKEEIFKAAQKAINEYNANEAKEVAQRGIAEGIEPMELMSQGFIPGISQVGERFSQGECFLPGLIQAADAMRIATEVINAAIPAGTQQRKGKIVVGTVEGDIHDIGKMIVVCLLKANGFEVYDLGRDIPTEKFIEKAEEVGADIIGTSALLTTTMEGQKKLELALKKAGLKGKYKTMVGGAPVTQRWADRIGADAYAEDAGEAVKKAKQLLGMG